MLKIFYCFFDKSVIYQYHRLSHSLFKQAILIKDVNDVVEDFHYKTRLANHMKALIGLYDAWIIFMTR